MSGLVSLRQWIDKKNLLSVPSIYIVVLDLVHKNYVSIFLISFSALKSSSLGTTNAIMNGSPLIVMVMRFIVFFKGRLKTKVLISNYSPLLGNWPFFYGRQIH